MTLAGKSKGRNSAITWLSQQTVKMIPICLIIFLNSFMFSYLDPYGYLPKYTRWFLLSTEWARIAVFSYTIFPKLIDIKPGMFYDTYVFTL